MDFLSCAFSFLHSLSVNLYAKVMTCFIQEEMVPEINDILSGYKIGSISRAGRRRMFHLIRFQSLSLKERRNLRFAESF